MSDQSLNINPTDNSPARQNGWSPHNGIALPIFDEGFPEDERLPEQFEMRITQRPSGESALEWNGVFIGDPLTDNILDSDGFRFHDVLHLANAAVLHWSPTIRALIQHQRRSDAAVREAQGRAACRRHRGRSHSLVVRPGEDPVLLREPDAGAAASARHCSPVRRRIRGRGVSA